MRIDKIHLENITTHVNSVIEFRDGINILAGENGTGKSTVLRMIGHVLFNQPSRGMDAFIRKGATSGSVTIWVSANDGHVYRVKRIIAAKRAGFNVHDETTGMDLRQVVNQDDLTGFLQTLLGLDDDTNPATIFKHAVGVDQGTFTAPFLETPKIRRDIFSPLLNVHVYERAWNKCLRLVQAFQEEIISLDTIISNLDGRLEQREALVKQNAGLEASIAALEAAKLASTRDLEDTTKEHETLQEVKTSLDNLRREVDQLSREGDQLDGRIATLEVEFQESTTAVATCQATRQDHDTHEILLVQVQDLESKNERRASLLHQKASLDAMIDAKNAELKRLGSDVASIKEEMARLPSLKKEHELHVNAKMDLEAAQAVASRVASLGRQVHETRSRIAELDIRAQVLTRTIAGLPALLDESRGIEAVEQALADLAVSVRSREASIKQLEAHKVLAADGTCPFLHEQCKNIGGVSLVDHFQREIDEARRAINALGPEMNTLKEALTTKQAAAERARAMEIEKTTLSMLQGQVEGYQKDIESWQQEINEHAGVDQRIERLREFIGSSKQGHDQFIIVSERVSRELPRLERAVVQANRERDASIADLATVITSLDETSHVPGELATVKASLESTRVAYGKYKVNERLASKLPAIQDSLARAREERQGISTRAGQVKDNLVVLERSFDPRRFAAVETRKNELFAMVHRTAGELAEKKNILASNMETLAMLDEVGRERDEKVAERASVVELHEFAEWLRGAFRYAGPRVTGALMETINGHATMILRELMGGANLQLTWKDDYEIVVTTPVGEKHFSQLSGGEQMACALSVRLAILHMLSHVEFAFFDEPTTNLDPNKRENLAQHLGKVSGLKQLFIISHDDAFETRGDFVIRLVKSDDEETTVTYMQQVMP